MGGVGASASAIPDSEQKTKRKGSVSGTGASGGGKAEKKFGIFGRKKAKVTPIDTPSVRTLSVSSEPPAQSPKRPEDEPESRKESVSDVEEKRVMAECQERIGALEEEVKKLNSEKEEAKKSKDERETEMQRVNNENNELRASIKEKEVEMEEKVREGETKWKAVIEAAISEKEEVIKIIVEECEKKVTESQTQLNLIKQQTELTLQAKTIELQGKDVRALQDKDEKQQQAQSGVKSKTLGKTDNVSPEPGAFQRLKTQYLRMLEEKMQLLDKLEKRDNQLKALREEKLAKGEESTANYPDVMHLLSVGDTQSPADPRAEVDRLRGVLDDREKKIHNLQVQLNSFQQVAIGNATLEEQIIQLKGKLEASEVHVMIIIIMFIIIIYFIEKNQKIEE